MDKKVKLDRVSQVRSIMTGAAVMIGLSIIAVVACGPKKNYVTAKTAEKSAFYKSLESCRDQSLPTGTAKKVGDEETSVKHAHICEAFTDQNKVLKYAFNDKEPIKFSVERNGRDLQLSIAMGMVFSANVTAAQKTAAVGVVSRVCAPALARVWRRNGAANVLSLQLSPIDVSATTKADVDHEITLNTQTSGEDVSFSLSTWPDGGSLVPALRQADKDTCSSLKLNQKTACLRRALTNANMRFCQSVATLVGYWVGLKGDPRLEEKCLAPPLAPLTSVAAAPPNAAPVQYDDIDNDTLGSGSGSGDDASDAAKGKTTATSPSNKEPSVEKITSYMQAAAALSSAKFFEQSSLEKNDVSTILAPVCPSVKILPRPTPVIQPKK